MRDKPAEIASRNDSQLTPRGATAASPFRMLERVADEMDRMFEDFGVGLWVRHSGLLDSAAWVPRVDVSQRNNEFVIRADLPGLTRDDVKVNVTEDAVTTIRGERRNEQAAERAGVYRSALNDGSFYRAIRLPPGAIADQAKASFKDGSSRSSCRLSPTRSAGVAGSTSTEGAERTTDSHWTVGNERRTLQAIDERAAL